VSSRRSLLSYFRLLTVFAKYSLAREMAFRGNFAMKVLLELVWLAILLIFFRTLFRGVETIAGWDQHAFLFFIGCYYALEGVIETFFLENFVEFGDLVRSGNLDLHLLKPIDEQFLLSFRYVDWSTVPKVFIGAGMMSIALVQGGTVPSPIYLILFMALFLAGVSMSYSFLLLLSSTAIWMVRNQSLMELWWLFTTLMRYPRDIYDVSWAIPIKLIFSFILPALLVISVPSEVAARQLVNPLWITWTIIASVLSLKVSRMVFQWSIRSYRSASS